MPNYNQGKIYKIVSNTDTDICYVGSTTRPLLCQRMEQHRWGYKYLKSGYKTSNISSYILFDKYGVENCSIELIEMFPCNTKDELTKREGYYIRSLNCVNKIIAGRTRLEWYEANRDTILNSYKEYREANPEYKKKWHKANPKANREYQRKWYETNCEKYTCICGSTLQTNGKSQHERSLKHRDYCISVSVVL